MPFTRQFFNCCHASFSTFLWQVHSFHLERSLNGLYLGVNALRSLRSFLKHLTLIQFESTFHAVDLARLLVSSRSLSSKEPNGSDRIGTREPCWFESCASCAENQIDQTCTQLYHWIPERARLYGDCLLSAPFWFLYCIVYMCVYIYIIIYNNNIA